MSDSSRAATTTRPPDPRCAQAAAAAQRSEFDALCARIGKKPAQLLVSSTVAIGSIDALVCFIDRVGPGWHSCVPGVGRTKARAIELELVDLLSARRSIRADIVPMESLDLDAHLLGISGKFRAPADACLLEAQDDLHAIQVWLQRYQRQPHTLRAYRKEVERFVIWCVKALRKPISSVSHADALAYREFLFDPKPHDVWCGARSHRRGSPHWRPFEGPLSHSAIKQAVTILHGLYAFLVDQSYLVGNPFSGVDTPRAASAEHRVRRRALTDEELDYVLKAIDRTTRNGRRLRAIFALLYATGFRLAAIAQARWSDLERVQMPEGDYVWVMHAVVKRSKEHEMAIPEDVLVMLQQHGIDRGLEEPCGAAWRDAALIGRVTDPGGDVEVYPRDPRAGLNHDHLASIIKEHFLVCSRKVSEQGREEMARKLEHASTHWMRHTFATHALRAKRPIEEVRDDLAHSSIAITGLYIDTERSKRFASALQAWRQGGARRF